MITAKISSIEYVLPDRIETNEDLGREFPEWNIEKILAKTGIASRRRAAEGECASDLAVRAAQKLFASGACQPGEVDFLLFCTQTPDYILPTTACTIQHRLGIPQTAGALDFNLGCSGYIYGLSLAKGLIETGQARTVLLLTADTYSKLIEPENRNIRTLFSDAGAVTLIRGEAGQAGDAGKVGDPSIGPFVFGTDGSGAENLIVRVGGFREPAAGSGCPVVLHMNGPEIFNFSLRVVPDCVARLFARASKTADDIALFVPHQANSYMLDHLREKMGLPGERFYIGMRDWGNTVSASIPIALKDAATSGRLRPGGRAMLLGFGVGYSWGGCLVSWQP